MFLSSVLRHELNLNVENYYNLTVATIDPLFGIDAIAQPPPYAHISEQPANKAHRFRYPNECRSESSILGASSTVANKTYPTIKIHNYTGEAAIIVSCVTAKEPYRPHPHCLVGKDVKNETGVCEIDVMITEEINEFKFENLAIQCLKKSKRATALNTRKSLGIDPFETSFDCVNNLQSIEMYAVRLCFQVVLSPKTWDRRCLSPVVSNIIYDKKIISELVIGMASHSFGPASGGTEVTLLCGKFTKKDMIVFYLEENNEIVWQATADVVSIHKQCALVIKTPAFMKPYTSESITVRFQQRKQLDGARSNSLQFTYIPNRTDGTLKRKRVSSLMSLYDGHSQFNKGGQEPPGVLLYIHANSRRVNVWGHEKYERSFALQGTYSLTIV